MILICILTIILWFHGHVIAVIPASDLEDAKRVWHETMKDPWPVFDKYEIKQ